MAEMNPGTEEAFERYYERLEVGRNTGWLYLGFASLLAVGILAGMILNWSLEGDAARYAPGEFMPGETQYVMVAGVGDVEVKALEYSGLFVAFVMLIISYVMAGK